MKHIVKEISDNILQLFNPNKIHPFISENLNDILVFDIETTGLHHKSAQVILIGYLYLKNDQIYIEQLFAETPAEEKEILMTFKEIVRSYPYLLSYNGNTFDIPFLRSRYKYHGIDCPLDKSMNIDLLKVARQLSKELDLENYKLKTVEEFLGIYREDAISGKESVDLYFSYVKNPSDALRETILLHNFEDILYLGKVVDLLYYQHQEDHTNIPIYFIHNKYRYYINHYKVSKDFLFLTLFIRNHKDNQIHYGPGQINYIQEGHEVKLKAPIFKLKVNDEELIFLDIDLMTEGKVIFNNMTYDEKIECLVTPLNLLTCSKKILNCLPFI